MDIPALDFKDCASIFVRDEFYENIQAPKYHDFCVSEEPGDPDSWFQKSGVSGKIPKELANLSFEIDPNFQTNLNKPNTPDLQSRTGNTSASTLEEHSTENKASAVGKEVRSSQSSSLSYLCKTQNKAKGQSKTILTGTSLRNTTLKCASEARRPGQCHQSTENQDPNSRRPRKTERLVANTPGKNLPTEATGRGNSNALDLVKRAGEGVAVALNSSRGLNAIESGHMLRPSKIDLAHPKTAHKFASCWIPASQCKSSPLKKKTPVGPIRRTLTTITETSAEAKGAITLPSCKYLFQSSTSGGSSFSSSLAGLLPENVPRKTIRSTHRKNVCKPPRPFSKRSNFENLPPKPRTEATIRSATVAELSGVSHMEVHSVNETSSAVLKPMVVEQASLEFQLSKLQLKLDDIQASVPCDEEEGRQRAPWNTSTYLTQVTHTPKFQKKVEHMKAGLLVKLGTDAPHQGNGVMGSARKGVVITSVRKVKTESDNSDTERLKEKLQQKANQIKSMKRKSVDMIICDGDERVNCTGGSSCQAHLKAQTGLHSLSTSNSSHRDPPATRENASGCPAHKKMRITCPQPFRLRTEERGALKEVQFNMKVQQALSNVSLMPNKDTKLDETTKGKRKQIVLQTPGVPYRPLKPQKSGKPPTFPKEPKFQSMKRPCPLPSS